MPRGWDWYRSTRLALVVGSTLALALSSFVNAVSNVTQFKNPAIALRFAPADPEALANAAETSITDGSRMAEVEKSARLSLKGLAINPVALRLLGHVEDVAGHKSQAGRLLNLSERASRRDLATQLWLIEYTAGRGDIDQTFRHYDAALRANPESGALLFPILANAFEDPALRKAFLPYIRINPYWMSPFLSQSIAESDHPEAIAQTLGAAGGMPDEAKLQPLETILLARLANAGQLEAARRFFGIMRGSDRNILAFVDFDIKTTDLRFAPLTWQNAEKSSIGATFEGGKLDRDRQVRVFAASGESGVALRRFLFLAPGRYAFQENRTLVDTGAQQTDFYWQIKCVSEGQAKIIWRSGRAEQLVIPSACKAQLIELYVDGGVGQNGVEAIVHSLRFNKLPS